MKQFFIVFGAVFVLIISLLFSNLSLECLLKNEIIQSSVYGGVGEVVYAAGDLGFVLEQNTGQNSLIYKKNNNIVGECVWIKAGQEKLNYICNKLGLTILKKYFVGERLLIEGRSSLLKYKLNGTNQNVQICSYNNLITIGSPIIYGNY